MKLHRLRNDARLMSLSLTIPSSVSRMFRPFNPLCATPFACKSARPFAAWWSLSTAAGVALLFKERGLAASELQPGYDELFLGGVVKAKRLNDVRVVEFAQGSAFSPKCLLSVNVMKDLDRHVLAPHNVDDARFSADCSNGAARESHLSVSCGSLPRPNSFALTIPV
jgi:hypothetical protein